jgi:hypothetical protein
MTEEVSEEEMGIWRDLGYDGDAVEMGKEFLRVGPAKLRAAAHYMAHGGFQALQENHPEALAALISRGDEVREVAVRFLLNRDTPGGSVLRVAGIMPKEERQALLNETLVWAIALHKDGGLAVELVAAGADVNAAGGRPLRTAARAKWGAMIEWLNEKGALVPLALDNARTLGDMDDGRTLVNYLEGRFAKVYAARPRPAA